VRLGAPEVDGPQLTVQLADATDGAAATLVIGTTRDAPLGPFSAVVRVPTTSPRHPMLRIPVTGIIAADAPMPRFTPVPPPDGDTTGDGAADAGEP
jgi:hypothetical protein